MDSDTKLYLERAENELRLAEIIMQMIQQYYQQQQAGNNPMNNGMAGAGIAGGGMPGMPGNNQ